MTVTEPASQRKETLRPECPFPGLRPFNDPTYFFGREREVQLATANLLTKRLTVLFGPTGSGKSSVLKVGVVTAARKDGCFVVYLDRWQQGYRGQVVGRI